MLKPIKDLRFETSAVTLSIMQSQKVFLDQQSGSTLLDHKIQYRACKAICNNQKVQKHFLQTFSLPSNKSYIRPYRHVEPNPQEFKSMNDF